MSSRTATTEDQSSTAEQNRESWLAQRRQVLALIDEMEELVPSLHDEAMCWLIGYLVGVGDGRPLDRRDPWSVLLHSFAPGRERVGQPLPALIAVRWSQGGYRGTCQRSGLDRYVITLDDRLNRAERRATLAHELAHVDLLNHSLVDVREDHWSDPVRRAAYLAEERRTDERAAELYDFDPAARPARATA